MKSKFMKKSKKHTKRDLKLRDLKPKKDTKGGGDIPITKLIGSSSPAIQR